VPHISRQRFIITFLVVAAAAVASTAQARVGVTSETSGDPLGRPPSQAERVLRVGIDIQADEVITTGASDAAHLVFLDGTSLTVSSNAKVKVDRFVYDPAAKTGEIAISATAGIFRLVGGKISKATPVTVNTPSGTIGIRGGIGLFTVEASQTTAQLLFGASLTMTGAGRTETALRPGSEIRTVTGGAPGTPSLIANGALSQVLSRLEAPGQRTVANANASPDQKAVSSGFSDRNSGAGTGPPPAPKFIAEGLGQAINSNVLGQIRAVPTAVSFTAAPISFPAPPPPPPMTGPGCIDTSPHHHHHHHHRR